MQHMPNNLSPIATALRMVLYQKSAFTSDVFTVVDVFFSEPEHEQYIVSLSIATADASCN